MNLRCIADTNSSLLTKMNKKVSVLFFHNFQEVLLAFLELCISSSLNDYEFSAISALLRHLDTNRVKIGVGGALIQFHPTYHSLLEAKLSTLAPPTCDVSGFLNYAVEIRYSIRKITCCFIVMQPRFSFTSIFQWQLVPADEGSAKGAAMIAAVAEKLHL